MGTLAARCCTGVWKNKKYLSSLSVTLRKGIIALLLSGAARGDSYNPDTRPGVVRYLDPYDRADSTRRVLSHRSEWCGWGGEQPVERHSRGKACHELRSKSSRNPSESLCEEQQHWLVLGCSARSSLSGSFPEGGASVTQGLGPTLRASTAGRPRLHGSARVWVLEMACSLRSGISRVHY